MKTLKTKILGLIGAIVAVGTLVGCGGNNQKDTDVGFVIPEGGFDTTKDVEIMFYNTMGSTLTPKLDDAITRFQAQYPNITVKYNSIGGYDDVRDQIATEISVGGQPNLAYCYPDHVALYNKAKAVIQLDNLINDETLGLTEAQIADFIPGYYNEGKVYGDDHMYTLPFSKSTEVLYYNVEKFAELELDAPTHWFSTGDDDKLSMEYACKVLKEADPKCTPLGYDSDSNWFITLCEQYGIPYTAITEGKGEFLFNNQEIKDILLKLRDWYSKGYFTTQLLLGTYTSSLFVETGTGETAVKSYMSIGSSAGATHQRPTKVGNDYPFTVGIVPIPQANENNQKVICQGPSVCIFANEDPQKVIASWLFLKFCATDFQFQAEFADVSGYVPVIKSVMQDETFAANLAAADGKENIAYLSMKVCLEQEQNYFVSPAFVGSSTARDEVGALLDAIVIADHTDVEINNLFQAAIDECNYQAGN